MLFCLLVSLLRWLKHNYNILIKKKMWELDLLLACLLDFFFLNREALRQYYQNMNLRASYQSSGSGGKTKIRLGFRVMWRMEENWNSCSFLWSYSVPLLNPGKKGRGWEEIQWCNTSWEGHGSYLLTSYTSGAYSDHS